MVDLSHSVIIRIVPRLVFGLYLKCRIKRRWRIWVAKPAHLGERLNGIQEVRGSGPLVSTEIHQLKNHKANDFVVFSYLPERILDKPELRKKHV